MFCASPCIPGTTNAAARGLPGVCVPEVLLGVALFVWVPETLVGIPGKQVKYQFCNIKVLKYKITVLWQTSNLRT